MDGAELHASEKDMQLSALSVCECVSKMTNVVLLPAVEYQLCYNGW